MKRLKIHYLKAYKMNNFYVRKQTFNEEVIKETDYNGLIKSVINYFPNLTLNPNSNLAALATQQYNQKLINNNSMDRPNIPDWFCGYRDTESGLLYLSDFESDSLEKININTNYNLSIQLLSSYNVRYTSDKCLEIGQSGSYDYSFCLSGASLTLEELIGIDWSQSFYPTDLIDTTISKIESAVRLQIDRAILEEQASSLGESAGSQAIIGSSNPSNRLNISGTKQVGNVLGSASISSDGRFINFKINSWPSGWGNAILFLVVGDVAGKFEWMTSGGQKVKETKNIYNGYEGIAPPPNGTRVGFVLSNSSKSERSNVVYTTWISR